MSFDWDDYLTLAKELAEESNEAKLRSAISRAYYAVFCKARNYLRDVKNISLSKSSQVHRLVSETFKAQSDKKLKQIGVNLDRLRVDRNKSDYDDVFPNIDSQVKVDLSIAQETYEILKSLFTNDKL